MAFIKSSSQITEIPDSENYKEKWRYIQLFLQDAQAVVNGGIELSNNVSLPFKSVTFSAANTDKTIEHGLDRAPRGYFVISRSAGIIVYDGSVASTSANITLRASGVGTAKIVFL